MGSCSCRRAAAQRAGWRTMVHLQSVRRGSHHPWSILSLAAIGAALAMTAAAPAASASNRVMSWGYTSWGRLGNGTSTFYETDEFHLPNWLPTPVCAAGTAGACPSGPYLNELNAISAGGTHGVALLSNDTVTAWGENAS